MRRFRFVSLAVLLLFAVAIRPIQAHEDDPHMMEARQTVKKFADELRGHLQTQMKAGGIYAAIGVCADVAPAVYSRLSRETGWTVRRVSLKVRNALDIPDAWERAVLQDFDKKLAAGAEPGKLEHSETVTEGDQSYFRYLKAIPTAEVCLTCHGAPEQMPAEVQTLLKEKYPHDKATGYSAGTIRGAFAIKRPLP
ncbi:MAG: DUF3365 domain-containing protein [bacterium]|nr:DUF3365 domain-containing protein [bacterium]